MAASLETLEWWLVLIVLQLIILDSRLSIGIRGARLRVGGSLAPLQQCIEEDVLVVAVEIL